MSYGAARTMLVVAIMLAWLALAGGCGGKSDRGASGTGGLTDEDVKSELKNLPRPMAEFAAVIPYKQEDIGNFMSEWESNVMRRPDLVAASVEMNARNSEGRVLWAEGKGENDVAAAYSLRSWDVYGVSEGGHHGYCRLDALSGSR